MNDYMNFVYIGSKLNVVWFYISSFMVCLIVVIC